MSDWVTNPEVAEIFKKYLAASSPATKKILAKATEAWQAFDQSEQKALKPPAFGEKYIGHPDYPPSSIVLESTAKGAFVFGDGHSTVYQRVAHHYGLTAREISAFVHANDAGCTFDELADVLASIDVPHTGKMTPDRKRIEASVVSRLRKIVAAKRPKRPGSVKTKEKKPQGAADFGIIESTAVGQAQWALVTNPAIKHFHKKIKVSDDWYTPVDQDVYINKKTGLKITGEDLYAGKVTIGWDVSADGSAVVSAVFWDGEKMHVLP